MKKKAQVVGSKGGALDGSRQPAEKANASGEAQRRRGKNKRPEVIRPLS
jgi:hypothetical protein